MSISFSHALNSSFPHIGWNGRGFKTPIDNFGRLMPSSFHNHMVEPSLGFHKALIRDILYYITSHLTSSTKNRNTCIFVWLTRTFRPSFKYPLIQNLKSRISLMSYIMNGWSFESTNTFIKFAMTFFFFFSIYSTNIQTLCQYFHVCAHARNFNWTSSKTSQIVSKERNANNWRFLLSFTQSSIWRSNFFGNDFTPIILFVSFNAFKQ